MASNVETIKEETTKVQVMPNVTNTSTNADRSSAVRPREDKNDILEEEETGASLTPPHAKKQRIEGNFTSKACSLLDSSGDTLQCIRSFLSLKEALALRTTCTQLCKDSNDAFRHCTLVTYEQDSKDQYSDLTDTARHGFLLPDAAVRDQQYLLWKTVFDDNDKLRALLANKSFHGPILEYLLWNLVDKAKTDNGQAVSILLKDGRCKVNLDMLDILSRKDFTAMATAFQEDCPEYIREYIQLCVMCGSKPRSLSLSQVGILFASR